MRDAVSELLNAPCGHWVRRDSGGNSVVTLYPEKDPSITKVAATFEAAVFSALDTLAASSRRTNQEEGANG